MSKGGVSNVFKQHLLGKKPPMDTWMRLYESKWVDSAGDVQIVEPNDPAYAPVKLHASELITQVVDGDVLSIEHPGVTFESFETCLTILGAAVTDASERVLFWMEFAEKKHLMPGDSLQLFGGVQKPKHVLKPSLNVSTQGFTSDLLKAEQILLGSSLLKALKAPKELLGISAASHAESELSKFKDAVLKGYGGAALKALKTPLKLTFVCPSCNRLREAEAFPVTVLMLGAKCPTCSTHVLRLQDAGLGKTFELQAMLSAFSQRPPVFIEAFAHGECAKIDKYPPGETLMEEVDLTVRASQRCAVLGKYAGPLTVGQPTRIVTGEFALDGVVVAVQQRKEWRVMWLRLTKRWWDPGVSSPSALPTALPDKKFAMQLTVLESKAYHNTKYRLVFDAKALVMLLEYYGLSNPHAQVVDLMSDDAASLPPSVLNGSGLALSLIELINQHYINKRDAFGLSVGEVFTPFGVSVTKQLS